jgi:hypothetical protein
MNERAANCPAGGPSPEAAGSISRRLSSCQSRTNEGADGPSQPQGKTNAWQPLSELLVS